MTISVRIRNRSDWLEQRLKNVKFTLLKYELDEWSGDANALVQLDQEMIVWKKVRECLVDDDEICIGFTVIALGLLPDTWMVLHAAERKCRVNWALVQAKQPRNTMWRADYDTSFVYEPGQVVMPIRRPFNDEPTIDCGSGIHCLLTKKEAEEWYL